MQILVGTVLLATAFTGSQGAGQSGLAPTPIQVHVTGDDSLRGQLSECLLAELGEVPGTVVADDPSALTLDVIVDELAMTDGSLMGYLIYAGGYLPGPRRAEGPADHYEARSVVIRWQSLRLHPPDLDAACRAIAEGFKTEVVVPVREELERIRNLSPRPVNPETDGQ